MKRTLIFSLLFLASAATTVSCQPDKKTPEVQKTPEIKEDKGKKPDAKKETLSVDPTSLKIKWTAYKTTAKVPVSGIFKTIQISEKKTGITTTEALNGLKFTIPIKSIFSNNEDRDSKLMKSFFGKMKETININGIITAKEDSKASVMITMNGISETLPVTYIVDKENVTMKATMNLKTWKGEIAIAALNEVCKEKHKGKDGVSKTWDEVEIEVQGKIVSAK